MVLKDKKESMHQRHTSSRISNQYNEALLRLYGKMHHQRTIMWNQYRSLYDVAFIIAGTVNLTRSTVFWTEQ